MKTFASFLFLLLAFQFNSLAQPILGISDSTNLADTVPLDSTTSFSLFIKNTGDQVFQGGRVAIHHGLDSLPGEPGGVHSVDVDSIDIGLIDFDDSLMVVFEEEFTSLKYQVGNNIIVIWPVSPDVPSDPSDTLFREVVLIDPFTWIELPPTFRNKNITLFPNPAQSTVSIRHPFGENTPLRIEVRDLSGRLIKASNGESFSTRELVAGEYIVLVFFDTNKPTPLKLIKTNQ